MVCCICVVVVVVVPCGLTATDCVFVVFCCKTLPYDTDEG